MFLPRECLVCGRTLLRGEQHLCLPCMEDLPRTWHFSMEHNAMADRFNAMIQRDLTAWEEAVQAPLGAVWREPYERAAALFFYNANSSYRNIPQSIKYKGNVAAGRFFGTLLGEEIRRDSSLYGDVTVVMPVPLHPLRRWRRGYNQAEVIAKAVAGALGVPMETHILSRKRRTRTQTRLSVEQKAANVRGAFGVNVGRLRKLLSSSYLQRSAEGRINVLLIDDVFTTGATLNACHHALREAFTELGIPPQSARISIATLAFVGSP
ncbi:MAG: ComF family protein [Bacteroidales bacterium]|nr:ComF family protein [Bacteroidales bacterium]